MKASVIYAHTQQNASALLTSFVATCTIQPGDATSLPIGLIKKRTNGNLLYPSNAFYQVVILMEFAYSRLLTVENLIIYGGDLIKKVRHLLENWPLLLEAISECLASARLQARSAGIIDFDATSSIAKILRLFMRIRGKDAVKTIVSELNQKASLANSLRGNLAAAAASASKKQKRASNPLCDIAVAFDLLRDDDIAVAFDLDVEEATDDFLEEEEDGLTEEE